MGTDSCTVAVEMGEHHITIHFKSDGELRTIYVHPDNVVMTRGGTRDWSLKCGAEYKLYQNKIQARASLESLCSEMRKDKQYWGSMGTDAVLGLIEEKIGMCSTLWTKVKGWVKRIINVVIRGLGTMVSAHLLGAPTVAGSIGWR
jgi:hypothetical protein